MAAEPVYKEVMGFKLGQFLGHGAFGFVKEASLNGRTYAMKVLTKGSSGWNASEEEKVKEEIAIMQKLDHPHIIRVISFEMNAKYPRESGAEDCVIIVMELAQGGNLFDVLYFTGGLTEEITRTYLAQLVDAIGAMHDLGIAHRDLKPQNTLLDSNFNLKICDFGFSKETHGASLMSTNLGTMPYQAPEILQSKDYDFKVDVFALGVLYFLMLTGGFPPFQSATETDNWFKYCSVKHEGKFWKRHIKLRKIITTTCGGEEEMRLAVQLFFSMCAYQPGKRPTIQEVATHDWFNKPKMEGEELKTVMKQIVNIAMAKKREDPELGGEVSAAVRGMEDLDFDQEAPEDPSRYVHGFTYAIVNSEHPYSLFKSIEEHLKTLGVEDNSIVFDEDEFTMNVQTEFEDQTVADILVRAYKEDGVDYLSFEKKKAEEEDFSFEKTAKMASMLAVNMLIEKIITKRCQQLGEMKINDVEEQPLSESQINDVREHMKKMMEGGEN